MIKFWVKFKVKLVDFKGCSAERSLRLFAKLNKWASLK